MLGTLILLFAFDTGQVPTWCYAVTIALLGLQIILKSVFDNKK